MAGRDIGYLEVSSGSATSRKRAGDYTVRDADLSVVHSGELGSGVTLDAGLYSVEFLDSAGAPERRIVKIDPGKTASVSTHSTAPVALPELPAYEWRPGHGDRWLAHDGAGAGRLPDLGEHLAQGDGVAAEYLPERPDGIAVGRRVDLLGGEGWVAATGIPLGWEFQPKGAMRSVATALFEFGGAQWRVSLPLNPGWNEDSGCVVAPLAELPRATQLRTAPVRAGFSPRREIAATLEGRLLHNTEASEPGLLEEATHLLKGKYRDPTAAALGGLVLHRLGGLRSSTGWLENLSRDFPWLPDGRILLAGVLSESREKSDNQRALKLLLEASRHRPLFTDALALALDILTRWPGKVTPARRTASGALSALAARADWSSICLATIEDPDEGQAPHD